MAAPADTWNTPVSGTGTLTPTVPAHTTDDVLVCAMCTEDNTATLTPPAGWALIPASQLNTTGIRLGAWWRRVGSGETVAAPAITKSAGTGAGVAVCGRIRGARSTGNPWAAAPIGQANASSTTVAFGGGITTTVADTLLVQLVANSTDTTTAQTSAYRAATDPVQASWTERQDLSTSTASGCGLGVAAAAKTSPGATGNMNATLATASVSVGIAFEVVPVAGAALTSSVDDAAGLTDSAQPVLSVGNVETAADAIAATDSTSFAVARALVIADGIAAADAAQTTGAFARSVADIGGVTDTTAAGLAYAVTVADTAGIGDTTGVLADDFAASAGSLLSTRAPWAVHPSGGDGLITAAGRVRHNGAGATGLLYAGADQPSGEYDVLAEFVPIANIGFTLTGLAGRLAAAANTLYLARYSGSAGAWQILKLVNGSATTLATSSAFPLTLNQSYRVRFVLRDAAKRLVVDGVEVCSTADNAIAGAGRAGVRLFDSGTNSDASGVHLDNFAVEVPGVVTAETYQRAVADSAGVTDAAAPVKTSGLALALLLEDAAGATDALSRSAALARSVADAGALTDAVLPAAGFGRVVADVLAAVDAAQTAGAFARALQDALAAEDSIELAAGVVVELEDAASIADVADTFGAFGLLLEDAVAAVDAIETVRVTIPVLHAIIRAGDHAVVVASLLELPALTLDVDDRARVLLVLWTEVAP